MDFSLNETQQAAAELADQILSSRIAPEDLRQREEAGGWFDSDTYAEVAKAGLTSISLGEDIGGGGLGLLELAQVLEAMGRHVAPLPLWSCSLAATAIDRLGTTEQRQAELPGVVDGSNILTVGLQEWHNDNYLLPETIASGGDGGAWQITGTKIVVEYAEEASKILVTASTDNGNKVGMFLVSLDDNGISMNQGTSISLQPVHEVTFTGAAAELVGFLEPPGNACITAWLHRYAVVMLCAIQTGVVDRALAMTAEYTSTREQFGRPIATFQAVTQRLADQFMHVNGIKLTTAKALYEASNAGDAIAEARAAGERKVFSDEELDALDAAIHTAKWFASHCAHEVAHAAQHVHGGMGVDRDYPLHRYTLWNKHLETALGAGTQQLRHLGKVLAGNA